MQAVRNTRVALFGIAVALVAGGGYCAFQGRARAASHTAVAVDRSIDVPKAQPETIVDPLAPERRITLDQDARADAGNWITARPGFQYSRSASERGGVEPCASQPVDVS